jgi:sulfite exporter TauE/SafE
VHGLAGSATRLLLVLAEIKSTWTGISYILLFGLGTAVSMGLISIFISLPFSASKRIPSLNRAVQATAGLLSAVFGLFLMYRIGITEGLFTGL